MSKNLLELYFDDSYKHFCRGVYYDLEGVAHSLVGEFRMGMFTDTYSIFCRGIEKPKLPVLRYYMGTDYVEFYGPCFSKEGPVEILVSNIGAKPLKVAFQYGETLWELQPGERKEIER